MQEIKAFMQHEIIDGKLKVRTTFDCGKDTILLPLISSNFQWAKQDVRDKIYPKLTALFGKDQYYVTYEIERIN